MTKTIHGSLTTAAHALVDPQPSPEARMKLAQGLLTLAALIEDIAAGRIGALQLLEAEGIIPGTEPHGRFRRQVARHAGLNATYATIVEFDMSHPKTGTGEVVSSSPTHDCDPGDCA
jgi:hypothetical protein